MSTMFPVFKNAGMLPSSTPPAPAAPAAPAYQATMDNAKAKTLIAPSMTPAIRDAKVADYRSRRKTILGAEGGDYSKESLG